MSALSTSPPIHRLELITVAAPPSLSSLLHHTDKISRGLLVGWAHKSTAMSNEGTGGSAVTTWHILAVFTHAADEEDGNRPERPADEDAREVDGEMAVVGEWRAPTSAADQTEDGREAIISHGCRSLPWLTLRVAASCHGANGLLPVRVDSLIVPQSSSDHPVAVMPPDDQCSIAFIDPQTNLTHWPLTPPNPPPPSGLSPPFIPPTIRRHLRSAVDLSASLATTDNSTATVESPSPPALLGWEAFVLVCGARFMGAASSICSKTERIIPASLLAARVSGFFASLSWDAHERDKRAAIGYRPMCVQQAMAKWQLCSQWAGGEHHQSGGRETAQRMIEQGMWRDSAWLSRAATKVSLRWVALDMLMGITIGMAVWCYGSTRDGPILSTLARLYAFTEPDGLRRQLEWLMVAPLGVKVNRSVGGFLGGLMLTTIELWGDLTGHLAAYLPALVRLVGLCGVAGLGVSFQLAMAIDILTIATLHLCYIYVGLARLWSVSISCIFALSRLFRGVKWNVLRERVDSCAYDLEQLIVGTLLFTVLTCLLSTHMVFYIAFLIIWIRASGPLLLLQSLLVVVNSLPLASLSCFQPPCAVSLASGEAIATDGPLLLPSPAQPTRDEGHQVATDTTGDQSGWPSLRQRRHSGNDQSRPETQSAAGSSSTAACPPPGVCGGVCWMIRCVRPSLARRMSALLEAWTRTLRHAKAHTLIRSCLCGRVVYALFSCADGIAVLAECI
ncbi:unnamed protein product [Vitrella brassicaformis CCMP3155]|uniref:Uncharacterized protein n=2 Tax=Vitrella brassicaformis TaxID=1169539 RepID=A0A0G4ELH4_VITBC|nr:unnamed protein product [Vitrella brassicaformis CCMP3155]|eukprot:CEL97668.1 unnamed protein product [Vitrella brassicaformis CCMP3155]